jgi:catechol 2,3-dioxygenase-like lactoylglutathione lyase family enzyme
MPNFDFVLLYVENPAASAQFYNALLGVPIVDQSPNFAMLPLRDGVMLGLWARADVEPAALGAPGGSEVAFTVADADAVQDTYQDWAKRGLNIAQLPTKMDFGTTFVALDPDGHRLRVFAPGA